jgi:hypothetical protein
MWREFRIRILPVAAFILAGLFAVVLWRQWVLVEESLAPAGASFAQEPGIIETGAAIAGQGPPSVAPLESAAARN